MTTIAYSRSPKLQKGALVQIVKEVVGVLPRILPFQYNPETLTRRLTPWNPFEVSETNRGQLAPTAQPFDPKESISVQIELDASDQLEDSDPIAEQFGVADRIAALEKLLLPTSGLVADLLNAAAAFGAALGGGSPPAQRPTVAVVLFVWGLGRILPVRVTGYSIEEQTFLPSLYPLQARVSLDMEVLTPDVFKCQDDLATDIAVAAYRFFRLQQEALALQHVARNLTSGLALLPL
jgi:hypothetical protein